MLVAGPEVLNRCLLSLWLRFDVLERVFRIWKRVFFVCKRRLARDGRNKGQVGIVVANFDDKTSIILAIRDIINFEKPEIK